MSDDPSARRHRISRADYAERFARGDSYGLLLALLGVLYLTIAAVSHQSLWGRFFVSVLLGAVLLLAFHTSHVRARGLTTGVVLVVVAATANLFQALFDRHGSDGSTYIMFVLVLIAPVVTLNRMRRSSGRSSSSRWWRAWSACTASPSCADRAPRPTTQSRRR